MNGFCLHLSLCALVALVSGCPRSAPDRGTPLLAAQPIRPQAEPEPEPESEIESLRQLCRTFVPQLLTVPQLTERLGEVEVDYGWNLQVVIRPRDPSFSKLEIVRRHGTELPSSINVHMSLLSRPTVAALRRAFGEFREAPLSLHGRNREIVFYPPGADPSIRCRLIAELPRQVRDIDWVIVGRMSLMCERP